MTLHVVRFATTAEAVPTIEAGIESMLAAVRAAAPSGTRYGAIKLADGVSFLLMLQLDDGVDNPLLAIGEAGTFQQQMRTLATEPPTPEPATVIGSYRLFG